MGAYAEHRESENVAVETLTEAEPENVMLVVREERERDKVQQREATSKRRKSSY